MKKLLITLFLLWASVAHASTTVGNLVPIMGVPNGSGYVLLTNPGGYFSIQGNNIIAADNTPAGQYSLTIQAVNGGISLRIKTFKVTYTPVTTGNSLLLEDNVSFLLLEDGVSHLCLEGGC